MENSRRSFLRMGAAGLCGGLGGCLSSVENLLAEQPRVLFLELWNCETVSRTMDIRFELDGEPVARITTPFEPATIRGSNYQCRTQLYVPPPPENPAGRWQTTSSIPSGEAHWPANGHWSVSARHDGEEEWDHVDGSAYTDIECTGLEIRANPDGDTGIYFGDCE